MRIKANGIDINYTIEGAGPWLTMSHSLACNLHMWDDQMIHANLPGSELKFIPSAAHLSNIEQTQIFNDALTRFLDRAGTTPK